MIQLLFAYLAGILTIGAPCILPVLPILLGASVGHQTKQRPLLIVAGFIVSFSAASLILATLIQNLGLRPDAVRDAAIFLLLLFGIFMVWPRPFEVLSLKLSGIINKANRISSGKNNLDALI